jgi:hypothetical protein
MKKRELYTTSEYLDALTLQSSGNLYQCNGKEFGLFSNAEAAEYDAKWLVNFYKREGEKRRKPTVYRIKLESVRALKKTGAAS